MNKSPKTNSKKWQKIGWAILLVVVVGYHFGRPTLEKLTGWSLPALDGSDEQAKAERLPGQQKDVDDNQDSAADSDAVGNDSKAGAGSKAGDGNETRGSSSTDSSASRPKKKSDNGPAKSSRPPPSGSFPLKEIGRDRFLTPAGLVYAMGPRQEHRIDHVMRHTKDDLSKPSHGVFNLKEKDEVLELVDTAYETVKKKKLKPIGKQRDREEFVINMGTVIGYKGGQSGRRSRNKKKLNRLKLILQDGNEVITAFPY